MFSTRQGSFQTSNSRSLSAHPFCYLALRQPCLLSCLEQSIKQSGLFTFNPFHLCPNSTSTKELLDQLFMCLHV